MTALTLAEYHADMSVPGIETTWTCDAEGNWRKVLRVRMREGDGWREFPVVPVTTSIDAMLLGAVALALADDKERNRG